MKNLSIFSVEELSTNEIQTIDGGGIVYEVFHWIGSAARTVYDQATNPNYTHSSGSALMHTALH